MDDDLFQELLRSVKAMKLDMKLRERGLPGTGYFTALDKDPKPPTHTRTKKPRKKK